MRVFLSLIIALAFCYTSSSQWAPMGNKIKTKWANEIRPELVLNEYPRPMMEREDWKNLNGLWDYAILPASEGKPTSFQGKILVPFAVESSLSGVMKEVGPDNVLWYHTSFEVPPNWNDNHILLHFGAVDWKADVWVNDIKIGSHAGGYTPFYFDISPYLNNGPQKLLVKVWDPTSDGPQPRGKQVKEPKGIWYTAVTGIWQTVWLEPVAPLHLRAIKSVPDIDRKLVKFAPEVEASRPGDIVEVSVYEGQQLIQIVKAAAGQELEVALAAPRLWSPESPFLYTTAVKLYRDGQVADEVKSYFGMRKISVQRDEYGIMRMRLNNEDYFQFGPLDQGWWPDGLYTAPTDDALKYDILKTKELGFNMIRKHVKVEPARWYTHCDRLGMLVWQDMPNGDKGPQWQNRKYYDGPEFSRSPSSEAIFRSEWKDIMDLLYSHPSIVVWVPFNEAWGQFKTEEITRWTQGYDPGRLVNSASGGNFYRTGDIMDLHNYPGPEMYLYDAERATVLGEYGGIGLALEGHLWRPDENWGYVKFKNSREVTNEYVRFAVQLKKMVKAGFSAAIYTQTTDVEGEVNGFMTYDRKVDKMNVAEIKKANLEVINAIHE